MPPKGKSRKRIGKRKWRRQNHMNKLKEEEMKDIVQEIRKEGGMDNLPSTAMTQDVSKMFTIDTRPDHEKQGKLDPARFKRKAQRPMPKIDQMKIDKMIRYGIPEEPKPDGNGLYDLWGNSSKKV